MTLAKVEHAVSAAGLGLVGSFHAGREDQAPEGIETIYLLGPAGPEMWKHFSASQEFSDGMPNPLDRWSRRVILAIADDLKGHALFPFDGPPWQPFQKWATKGEGAVSSPVGMQATFKRGLWTSYRGALGFSDRLELTTPDTGSTCVDCDAPCLTACPVGAFEGGSYDVPRCTSFLKKDANLPCRGGCLVRTACPYGAEISLPVEQKAFHIDAFLRANG